jgi:aldehyde dehydrogenase (NAD+)
LLVPKEHHDEIDDLIVENLAHVVYGDPADPNVYMGPLINERQRDKVHGMVERAVATGAKLVVGGEKVDPGYFYTPTLLTNVDPDSEIAQEEIFGPVLVVIGYDDIDDAVQIANNSIYGLAGAVFGRDQDRALAVARRIRAGAFSINGGNFFSIDTPFGGYKQSGVGREMGVAGLEEYLENKTFATLVE